ncbi:SDR family oxidoreductase [Candidatus Thorarchaeota archaeon]|nr:MAG: SDR family oxidoreductase [Candidatus Thorarchaeota archaeon]
MKTGLINKHVLITGASGGIGIQTVKSLLKERSEVSACYHTRRRQLNQLSDKYPDSLNLVKADVKHEDEVAALYESAVSRFGRVDVSIANAGIANATPVGIHEMTVEQWDNTLRVNLRGAFLTAKYFFKNLEDNPDEDASLILVGSTAGVFGEAWFADYSTSKAGMTGLMMSLKNEIVQIAPRGRVNIVNPGWTSTPMAEEALEDRNRLSSILQTIPMRKVATPSDITNAILYLASDTLSGHVSGQTITVAGGMEGRVLFSKEDAVRD